MARRKSSFETPNDKLSEKHSDSQDTLFRFRSAILKNFDHIEDEFRPEKNALLVRAELNKSPTQSKANSSGKSCSKNKNHKPTIKSKKNSNLPTQPDSTIGRKVTITETIKEDKIYVPKVEEDCCRRIKGLFSHPPAEECVSQQTENNLEETPENNIHSSTRMNASPWYQPTKCKALLMFPAEVECKPISRESEINIMTEDFQNKVKWDNNLSTSDNTSKNSLQSKNIETTQLNEKECNLHSKNLSDGQHAYCGNSFINNLWNETNNLPIGTEEKVFKANNGGYKYIRNNKREQTTRFRNTEKVFKTNNGGYKYNRNSKREQTTRFGNTETIGNAEKVYKTNNNGHKYTRNNKREQTTNYTSSTNEENKRPIIRQEFKGVRCNVSFQNRKFTEHKGQRETPTQALYCGRKPFGTRVFEKNDGQQKVYRNNDQQRVVRSNYQRKVVRDNDHQRALQNIHQRKGDQNTDKQSVVQNNEQQGVIQNNDQQKVILNEQQKEVHKNDQHKSKNTELAAEERDQVSSKGNNDSFIGKTGSHSPPTIPLQDSNNIRSRLIDYGADISDLIVGSDVAMNTFLSFYSKWKDIRKNTLVLFETLEKKLASSTNRNEKIKDYLALFGAGLQAATFIPIPKVSATAKILSTLSSVAKGLFNSKNSKGATSTTNDFELTKSLVEDIEATSDIYMYGLQCSLQFQETCSKIEELHGFLRGKDFHCITDVIEATFLKDILQYNPRNQIAFYLRLKIVYETLMRVQVTGISKSFCRALNDFPSALAVISCLHWRFQGKQSDKSEVLQSWEVVTELIQDEDNATVNEVIKGIQNCILILIKERSVIERYVFQFQDIIQKDLKT